MPLKAPTPLKSLFPLLARNWNRVALWPVLGSTLFIIRIAAVSIAYAWVHVWVPTLTGLRCRIAVTIGRAAGGAIARVLL